MHIQAAARSKLLETLMYKYINICVQHILHDPKKIECIYDDDLYSIPVDSFPEFLCSCYQRV